MHEPSDDHVASYMIERYAPDVLAVEPQCEPQAGGVAWAVVSGEETEDALIVHLIVAHPSEPSLTARVTLRTPIVINADGYVGVGAPTILEAQGA